MTDRTAMTDDELRVEMAKAMGWKPERRLHEPFEPLPDPFTSHSDWWAVVEFLRVKEYEVDIQVWKQTCAVRPFWLGAWYPWTTVDHDNTRESEYRAIVRSTIIAGLAALEAKEVGK